MRKTLYTIREVSGHIDNGSEQLACAAEDLAERMYGAGYTGNGNLLILLFGGMTDSMETNASAASESSGYCCGMAGESHYRQATRKCKN